MARLIRTDRHISDAVNNTDLYRVLRGRVSVLKKAPDARLMPYLELAGFRSVASILSSDLRFDLLSALVERWRSETHTFHFPCVECTFLGDSPGDGESYFSGIKFIWLKAKIEQLSATATEAELMCAARAYIMHIVGGVLMPDANSGKGSAVLAVLYRELCRATNPDAVDMGGCLILLQSWALYRMPFLASISHQPWSVRPGIGKSYNVPIYCLMIEQHAQEGFIWMPYCRPEITNVVPSSAYIDSYIWCTNTPIINFNMVEWYHGDRVLRQFGCIQPIPDPSCDVGEVHGINKRGKPMFD
ncbi:serine/threonine-protein phosphatase 7 long form homolog [Gossypium hirsutum]|uniref:Serine/threonine-protein phosphatase 7 long form homolog n=1 Tax=Gossypium hirsutum TaxID=3635 RepID=A0A1U8J7S6_GOSHI|nr:serine/threonine-protein phosphatase 7 long form homolog [Gossypium hirsutum]